MASIMENKKHTLHIGGKILALLQLILSAGTVIVVWDSGFVPMKYILLMGGCLLLLFGVTYGLQFIKNRVHIIGITIGFIVCIGLLGVIISLKKADSLMADVGGATYKTDNMVVVVKKDDTAANLLDTKSYRFGIQKSVDQENNQLMLEDVNRCLGREIKLQEYATLQEEAEALLKGRVDAVIYNEAFAGLIDETVEGYADQVRILYQYGINTELMQEDTSVQEPFNVYISGIDVSGAITTNSRSDVNIIMTVNPNTKKILLTNTPRDYYVEIPGISGEQKDKLTHAGIYGVDVSMSTLEHLYGLEITYFARVNFTSLVDIVDTLGGVDVNSEYEFMLHGDSFQIKKGINHLNGEMALSFSRERYSFESGDNQRGKNQEEVLTAILKKAMSPAILTNANKILANVGDSVETNMTREEMTEFINNQLADPSSWSIESIAAVGTGDNQMCFSSGSQILYVMHPDEASVQEAAYKIEQVLSGN